MIDPSRITQFDAILTNAAGTIPAKLKAFHDGLTAVGFCPPDALFLTVSFMQSVLAVPSEPEFPPQPGGGGGII